MKRRAMLLMWMALLAAAAYSQATGNETANSLRVALIKMPYVGERNVPELSGGPGYLEQGGIKKLFEERGLRNRAGFQRQLDGG